MAFNKRAREMDSPVNRLAMFLHPCYRLLADPTGANWTSLCTTVRSEQTGLLCMLNMPGKGLPLNP